MGDMGLMLSSVLEPVRANSREQEILTIPPNQL